MLKLFRYSDQQLLDLIRGNERKQNRAIEYILDDNRKKVKVYVLKNKGDEQDAESVLVEGVTHLLVNIRQNKFRGESQLNTYLFSICKGVWLKELRKRKRFIALDDDESTDDELVTTHTPLSIFSEQELQTEVNSLLKSLGNACERVLHLWAMHFSMTEIAKELGYKNSQIAMNKKNRCLGKLREILGGNQEMSDTLQTFLVE